MPRGVRKKAAPETAAEELKKETAAAPARKAAKTSTTKVSAAKPGEPKTDIFIQYQGKETDVSAAAKADFAAEHAGEEVRELKLYVKPEERAVYYVVNDTFNGCVKY